MKKANDRTLDGEEARTLKRLLRLIRTGQTEERYSRRVSMEEIEKNDYNLNISRYVSTSVDEEKIDLKEVNKKLVDLEKKINEARENIMGF